MKLLPMISSSKGKREYSLNHFLLTKATVPKELFTPDKKQDEVAD